MIAKTKTITEKGAAYVISLRVGCGMGKVTKSPKFKIGGLVKVFEGKHAEALEIFENING